MYETLFDLLKQVLLTIKQTKKIKMLQIYQQLTKHQQFCFQIQQNKFLSMFDCTNRMILIHQYIVEFFQILHQKRQN